jgi:protein gp37
MTDTAIEWAEKVWNPTTGCDRVSPGCDNCYALTMAKRLKGMGSAKYQTDGNPSTSGPGFGLNIHPAALYLPLRWRKPKRVFVNSMSDLFHDDIPTAFIGEVFAVMALAEQHTFQVLTKRHARMRSLLNSKSFMEFVQSCAVPLAREWGLNTTWAERLTEPRLWPLSNIWLGVSVENQQWADIRTPAMLETPAVVRWLSMEPLLGPVDLADDWLAGLPERRNWLDWIVVGGESGAGARPMEVAWAEALTRRCQDAGVPVFVKQLGSPFGKQHHDIGTFPESLRVREYPAGAR